jgi:hypothetical protein
MFLPMRSNRRLCSCVRYHPILVDWNYGFMIRLRHDGGDPQKRGPSGRRLSTEPTRVIGDALLSMVEELNHRHPHQ